MTAAQKAFIEIQKQQSTLRGEFNTLRGIETRSAEQDGRLTALDGELTDSETAFRTAADALLTEQTTTTAPGGEDTEARERRELCDRANVGDVYNSILEKRGATDGATAEAQAAHGCAPNQIPITMLRGPAEVRAVTPTPGASQTEQALNGGLQEKLDLDAIAGTDGLLTGSNLGNHNVTDVTTFALYLSQFLYGRVDGRYAESKADIRVLMGSVTYGHAGGVYQSSAYKSALSVLEQDSGGS